MAKASARFCSSTPPHHELAAGFVHEWLGTADTSSEAPEVKTRARRPWSPPLTLLVDAAQAAVAANSHGCREIVWIGREVWPSSFSLCRRPETKSGAMLKSSLFLRATKVQDRLWAADLSLRSKAAAGVVVNGSGFDLAATRRLQLAAEAGGAMCLLCRPAWEQAELSAAATRWKVSRCVSSNNTRRWIVELLRCKGMPPTALADGVWVLERENATGALRVATDVLDRPGQTTTEETVARRIG